MLAALDMALTQRRPEAVVHHSDRGCQYTSYAFGKRCRDAGVMPSMGSIGDAYDNAMAESFFRHARARSAQPATVPQPGRSADGDLPVAGGLVQSAPSPLGPRLSFTPSTTRGDSCRRVLETQVRTRPRNRGKSSRTPARQGRRSVKSARARWQRGHRLGRLSAATASFKPIPEREGSLSHPPMISPVDSSWLTPGRQHHDVAIGIRDVKTGRSTCD